VEVSADAQKKLQQRLGVWLERLLAYEGFRDWKDKSLADTLLISLIPDAEVVLAIVVAIAAAWWLGFHDGREHRGGAPSENAAKK
jgi:hypothetical protein